MARGGARQGTPGQSYSNRTDLQAVKTGPSQQYGSRIAQERAQQAVPLAGATNPGPSAPPAGAPAMPPGPMPGMLTPLGAPSERPGEPLTAGMAIGGGAGVEANPFANVGSTEDAEMALRAAYAAYPSEELRAILERLDLE